MWYTCFVFHMKFGVPLAKLSSRPKFCVANFVFLPHLCFYVDFCPRNLVAYMLLISNCKLVISPIEIIFELRGSKIYYRVCNTLYPVQDFWGRPYINIETRIMNLKARCRGHNTKVPRDHDTKHKVIQIDVSMVERAFTVFQYY